MLKKLVSKIYVKQLVSKISRTNKFALKNFVLPKNGVK